MDELNLKLEELLAKKEADFEISQLFKDYFDKYINAQKQDLNRLSGKKFFISHTKAVDNFIIMLYKYILRRNFGSFRPSSLALPITLVALGSYGREQLCLYSDIDLLLVYQDTKGYNTKNILEEFLTLAWDCGLKLGHKVHEISQLEADFNKDITSKTSALESRLIYGSKLLWHSYENVISSLRRTKQKEFILEKIEEQKKRLEKYPLNMQANIKDGYGGIRESNTLFWIANTIYKIPSLKELVPSLFTQEEYLKYRISLEFIFQVRNILHKISSKKQDLVNFDILPNLSQKLGFKDSKNTTKEHLCFSRLFEALHEIHFFTHIMTNKLTRRYFATFKNIASLRNLRYKKNLYIKDAKLYASFNAKEKKLTKILKKMLTLPKEVKSFDNSFIYLVSKSKINQNKELKVMTLKLLFSQRDIYIILKCLYEAKLFTKLFALSKKIINQAQFDGYHSFPVDIHCIKTIFYLENIDDDFILDIYQSLSTYEKSLVKISALFHDMGKGRKLEHHLAGEILFKKFAKSINMDEKSLIICAKLIKHHNLLSKTATREDIYSQKTILDFLALIKSELNIKLLLLLTFADIKSLGSASYTNSTLMLIKELFIQAMQGFKNTELIEQSSRKLVKIKAIQRLKVYKDLDEKMQNKIKAISSTQIFLQEKAENILKLSLKAKNFNDFVFDIFNNQDKHLQIEVIRSKELNLGFLLANFQSLNIISLNIFKLYDNKKFFKIIYAEALEEENLNFYKQIIKSSFDMDKKAFIKKPKILKKEVEVNLEHSETLVQMKINAQDQKGLFSYIAKVFDDFGIDIESAKIHTSKNKTRDMLLIEKNGNFCSKQDEILEKLCCD